MKTDTTISLERTATDSNGQENNTTQTRTWTWTRRRKRWQQHATYHTTTTHNTRHTQCTSSQFRGHQRCFNPLHNLCLVFVFLLRLCLLCLCVVCVVCRCVSGLACVYVSMSMSVFVCVLCVRVVCPSSTSHHALVHRSQHMSAISPSPHQLQKSS